MEIKNNPKIPNLFKKLIPSLSFKEGLSNVPI